jgi:hypothetical protein
MSLSSPHSDGFVITSPPPERQDQAGADIPLANGIRRALCYAGDSPKTLGRVAIEARPGTYAGVAV